MSKSIVKLKERDYNYFLEVAKEIDKERPQNREDISLDFYSGKHDFPTVYLLKKTHIEKKIKKYLPMLIYYKDVYHSSLDGVEELKEFLNDLFAKKVKIIPDTYFKYIEKISIVAWKNASIRERYEWFKLIFSYYDKDEFDNFLSDLEYYPFMKYYDLRKTKYDNSKLPIKLVTDLSELWEEYVKDSESQENHEVHKELKELEEPEE